MRNRVQLIRIQRLKGKEFPIESSFAIRGREGERQRRRDEYGEYDKVGRAEINSQEKRWHFMEWQAYKKNNCFIC